MHPACSQAEALRLGTWNEERKQNNCWTRKEIYSAPLFKHAFPQDCWALLAKCELWPPGTREWELFWQLWKLEEMAPSQAVPTERRVMMAAGLGLWGCVY